MVLDELETFGRGSPGSTQQVQPVDECDGNGGDVGGSAEEIAACFQDPAAHRVSGDLAQSA